MNVGKSIGTSSPEICAQLIQDHETTVYFLKAYVPGTHGVYDGLQSHKLATTLFSDALEQAQKSLGENYAFGMFSLILAKDSLWHIPMLDFSFSWSPKKYNTDRVKEVVESLNQREGMVLFSGRCFHCYGVNLLSSSEWQRMLSQASTLAEIGPNYPSRALAFGGNSLRLTTNLRKPTLPRVIDYLKI